EAELRWAREQTGFVHRRLGSDDLYFVSNISDHERNLRVRFACGHKTPELWDSETGEMRNVLTFKYVRAGRTDATEMDLHLEPFQSSFIVFTADNQQPLISRTNVRTLRLSRTPQGKTLTGEVS